MIRAVLLDIDDTLLDFDAYVKNSMKAGFDKFSLAVYDDSMFRIFKQVNSEMWKKLERGEITFEELKRDRWNNVFSALGISFDGQVFEKYFRDCLFDSAILIDGAKDILDYLSGKYIVCAASNGPYEQQLNRLKVGGIYSYFSNYFISEKIGAQKPSEEFFNFCMRELNDTAAVRGEQSILPSEVIMIGDSLSSDMTGTIISGIRTCFFDKHGTGKTNGMPVDHIVDRLENIRQFL